MGRPPDCNCFCGPPPPPLDCDCPELGSWGQFTNAALHPDGGRILVIQICNTNGARDDNMRIFLNGTSLGIVDHNSNTRTGIIFVSNPSVTIDDNDSLLVCQGENHQQVGFNPSILDAHPLFNAITARTVQKNNNGNNGELVIASYPMPYTPGDGCVLMQRSWSDAESWNYQFQLCEDTPLTEI